MRSKVAQRILDRTPKETKAFVGLYSDIVVRVHQLMEKKNLSQNKLAQKMGKKPSELSKWLSGNHNLTLRSIAKLQAELDEPVIEVPGNPNGPSKVEGTTERVLTPKSITAGFKKVELNHPYRGHLKVA